MQKSTKKKRITVAKGLNFTLLFFSKLTELPLGDDLLFLEGVLFESLHLHLLGIGVAHGVWDQLEGFVSLCL